MRNFLLSEVCNFAFNIKYYIEKYRIKSPERKFRAFFVPEYPTLSEVCKVRELKNKSYFCR